MITKHLITISALVLAAQCLAGPSEEERDRNNYPLTPGTFDRSWESLNQWECPDWFEDAKLGIWLFTGPQAVPLQSDWYALGMYIPGHHADWGNARLIRNNKK